MLKKIDKARYSLMKFTEMTMIITAAEAEILEIWWQTMYSTLSLIYKHHRHLDYRNPQQQEHQQSSQTLSIPTLKRKHFINNKTEKWIRVQRTGYNLNDFEMEFKCVPLKRGSDLWFHSNY